MTATPTRVRSPAAAVLEETLPEVEPDRPLRLYSAAELDYLPSPAWLVDGAIPEAGLVALIGAKGTYKTFVSLDLACHVALGRPWHGRSTAGCPTVYVYAEGAFGAKQRIDAWCEFNGEVTGRCLSRSDLPLWLLPTRVAVNVTRSMSALIAEIMRLPMSPRLIVIDTLNANLDGDEDGKGMGGFTAGCLALRDAFGATIMVVHHTPLSNQENIRGRGHSSFDGAVDTRLIVRRERSHVTVECTHQRNAEDGWSVRCQVVPSGSSLALAPAGMQGPGAPSTAKVSGQRLKILCLVHAHGPLENKKVVELSGMPKRSVQKALKSLREKTYVVLSQRKYAATSDGARAIGALSAQPVPGV